MANHHQTTLSDRKDDFMRKLKKRLAALGIGMTVLATSAMSMSASAVNYTSWWNFYTPRVGEFSASTTLLSVTDIRWTVDQQSALCLVLGDSAPKASVEFEFRPIDPSKENPHVNPHTIWEKANGNPISNLPDVHFEFQRGDPDDVSIACNNFYSCIPGVTYYAYQSMTPLPGAPTNHQYIFECEVGAFMGIDSLPLYCSEYPYGNTYLGRTYRFSGA